MLGRGVEGFFNRLLSLDRASAARLASMSEFEYQNCRIVRAIPVTKIRSE